jgi:hypothetical protein
LKANKVNLCVSSVLFVFWYHSPNISDTPRILKLPRTHIMTACINLTALLHGVYCPSFQIVFGVCRIAAGVVLFCTVLYARCSTISSYSLPTSQTTHSPDYKRFLFGRSKLRRAKSLEGTSIFNACSKKENRNTRLHVIGTSYA